MARILKTAYTFDDVLLVPNKSEILPNQVSLKTKLTKKNNIKYTVNECKYGYSY